MIVSMGDPPLPDLFGGVTSRVETPANSSADPPLNMINPDELVGPGGTQAIQTALALPASAFVKLSPIVKAGATSSAQIAQAAADAAKKAVDATASGAKYFAVGLGLALLVVAGGVAYIIVRRPSRSNPRRAPRRHHLARRRRRRR